MTSSRKRVHRWRTHITGNPDSRRVVGTARRAPYPPHSSPVWVITIDGIDGEWKIERTGISRWRAAAIALERAGLDVQPVVDLLADRKA